MAPRTAAVVKKGNRGVAVDHEKEDSLLLSSKGWPVTTSHREAATAMARFRKILNETSLYQESDDDDEDGKHRNIQGTPLLPGPRLQACNGQDIQVSRGAMTRPNVEKGKGRFLIVLPGLLSLKGAVNNSSSSSSRQSLSNTHAKDAKEDSDDAAFVLDESKAVTATTTLTTSAATPTTSTAPSQPATIMGRIEQLASDSPVLKVPWAGGRTLCFFGKKVPTSSKFMVLTCKNKGSVTCKDIFSSIIIFGNGLWEENSDGVTGRPLVDDTLWDQVVERKQGNTHGDDDDMLMVHNSNTEVTDFHHYGGSVRTVHGSTHLRHVRQDSRPQKPAAIQNPPSERMRIDHGDDDGERNDDNCTFPSHERKAATRQAPRRASQRIVRYSEGGDESDSEDDKSIDSNSTPRKPRAKRPKVLQKESSVKTDDDSIQEQSSDNDNFLESDDDDEDDEDFHDVGANSRRSRAASTNSQRVSSPLLPQTRRKQPTVKPSSNVLSAVDDQDNHEEEVGNFSNDVKNPVFAKKPDLKANSIDGRSTLLNRRRPPRAAAQANDESNVDDDESPAPLHSASESDESSYTAPNPVKKEARLLKKAPESLCDHRSKKVTSANTEKLDKKRARAKTIQLIQGSEEEYEAPPRTDPQAFKTTPTDAKWATSRSKCNTTTSVVDSDVDDEGDSVHPTSGEADEDDYELTKSKSKPRVAAKISTNRRSNAGVSKKNEEISMSKSHQNSSTSKVSRDERGDVNGDLSRRDTEAFEGEISDKPAAAIQNRRTMVAKNSDGNGLQSSLADSNEADISTKDSESSSSRKRQLDFVDGNSSESRGGPATKNVKCPITENNSVNSLDSLSELPSRSPLLQSPPAGIFLSKSKWKSPKKARASPAKRVIDLSIDDDFAFLK